MEFNYILDSCVGSELIYCAKRWGLNYEAFN